MKGKLNSPCKEDSLCTDSHATCTHGLCLCTDGYYFRNGTCSKY